MVLWRVLFKCIIIGDPWWCGGLVFQNTRLRSFDSCGRRPGRSSTSWSFADRRFGLLHLLFDWVILVSNHVLLVLPQQLLRLNLNRFRFCAILPIWREVLAIAFHFWCMSFAWGLYRHIDHRLCWHAGSLQGQFDRPLVALQLLSCSLDQISCIGMIIVVRFLSGASFDSLGRRVLSKVVIIVVLVSHKFYVFIIRHWHQVRVTLVVLLLFANDLSVLLKLLVFNLLLLLGDRSDLALCILAKRVEATRSRLILLFLWSLIRWRGDSRRRLRKVECLHFKC